MLDQNKLVKWVVCKSDFNFTSLRHLLARIGEDLLILCAK